MAHFLKRQFSAHHLLQGLLIFFKTQFALLQVTENARLTIRVQNLIGLLQTQCTETLHCFIMVECDDHAAHVKNHRFNHNYIFTNVFYINSFLSCIYLMNSAFI